MLEEYYNKEVKSSALISFEMLTTEEKSSIEHSTMFALWKMKREFSKIADVIDRFLNRFNFKLRR